MLVLREGLLSGRRVVVAADDAAHLRDALVGLGASVDALVTADLAEQSAEEWVRARRPVHSLVIDSAGAFGSGGEAGLGAALEQTWTLTRAVANEALIPSQAGKIVLLAPRPDSGPHAGAARSALENLARTLSVEWARHAVTVTAVGPGEGTSEGVVAELVAFLLSPAGDYLSGCLLELGAASR